MDYTVGVLIAGATGLQTGLACAVQAAISSYIFGFEVWLKMKESSAVESLKRKLARIEPETEAGIPDRQT